MLCETCERRLKPKDQVARLKGVGFFSVKKALDVIKKNKRKKPKLIGWEELSEFPREETLHTNHVTFRRPIIIGTFFEDGEAVNFILDGNDRATKAVKLKKDIKCYILTIRETNLVFEGKNPPQYKDFIKK